jgi:predicted Zn-ribbon and HTH transcriptional regulator
MTRREIPSSNRPASETLRRQIMAELESQTMTARDLSKVLRASEKEILGHLEHVAKSVRPPKRLIVEPPFCNKCQFIFSDRRKFSSPSRCPQCRHEGISPPAFKIE